MNTQTEHNSQLTKQRQQNSRSERRSIPPVREPRLPA
nr:MAG TPA: hypothetical protein [Caudoviricetes sp.]